MNVDGGRPQRAQSMAKLFDDAGVVFTWYRYVQTTGATASYGMGGTPQYATGYLTAIWQDPGKPSQQFVQQPGGQTVGGGDVVFSQTKVATADVLQYGAAKYSVVAEPWPCQLYGLVYWRMQLKRG